MQPKKNYLNSFRTRKSGNHPIDLKNRYLMKKTKFTFYQFLLTAFVVSLGFSANAQYTGTYSGPSVAIQDNACHIQDAGGGVDLRGKGL